MFQIYKEQGKLFSSRDVFREDLGIPGRNGKSFRSRRVFPEILR